MKTIILFAVLFCAGCSKDQGYQIGKPAAINALSVPPSEFFVRATPK